MVISGQVLHPYNLANYFKDLVYKRKVNYWRVEQVCLTLILKEVVLPIQKEKESDESDC